MTNESYPERQQTATESLSLCGHCPSEFHGQRGAILELLRSRKGQWIELFHFIQLAAQYNARIFELRRAGFGIENKTARVNGQVHGWFRLVSEPDERANK